MTGGYSLKLLHIDLSTGRIEQNPLKPEVARDFLGAKGLAARTFSNQVLSDRELISLYNGGWE